MGQEIYLGKPPENVVNFISAQYDAKRTTVSLTGYVLQEGEYVEILATSSFYDIVNYNCYQIADTMISGMSYYWYDMVRIGNTVTKMEDATLTSLIDRSVHIPESVSAISDNCFRGSNIHLDGIPKSVVRIGEDAFYDAMYYMYGSGKLFFFGRTMEEVSNIVDENGVKQYPWGLDPSKISAEYG